MDDPSKSGTTPDDAQARLRQSKDRAMGAVDSAARTVRDVAGERADEVRETVKDHVGEARSTLESGVSEAQSAASARLADARDTAMDKADQMRHAARDRADEGVSTAAQGLKGTAGRLREAAGDLDEKDRWLGTALEKAASTADRAGDYMSGQNMNDIVDDAQQLARRNPAAFMGGAAALGFALARLGKVTVDRATRDSGGYGGQGGMNRGSTYSTSDDTRRQAPKIPASVMPASASATAPTPAGLNAGTTAPVTGASATSPTDGRALNPGQSTPLHRSQT